MSIRVIVLVSIGKPFGGFRLAIKAGLLGINNKKAFEKLENIIDHVFDLLANTAFENWENRLNKICLIYM